MSTSENNNSFSPFWAVAWFLMVFTILTAVDIYGMFQYRAALQKALVESRQNVNRARAVNDALTGLTRDLLLLSDRSPGARQIVQDFGIRAVKGPNPAQVVAPKK